jgi:hypothetical protein
MECGGLNFSNEINMIATRWLIFVLVFAWVGSVSQPVYGADVYQGRVVDEETGQPLAGAVVTVVWFRSPRFGLEGTKDFRAAQEAVADNDGKFYLSVSPGSNWNPFSYIREEPAIVIYQPGYEPTWAGWMVRNKFNTMLDLARELKKGITIKLARLKTKEELIKFTNISSLTHVTVRYEDIPKLIQAVNVQNKMVGLKPYPAHGGKEP